MNVTVENKKKSSFLWNANSVWTNCMLADIYWPQAMSVARFEDIPQDSASFKLDRKTDLKFDTQAVNCEMPPGT